MSQINDKYPIPQEILNLKQLKKNFFSIIFPPDKLFFFFQTASFLRQMQTETLQIFFSLSNIHNLQTDVFIAEQTIYTWSINYAISGNIEKLLKNWQGKKKKIVIVLKQFWKWQSSLPVMTCICYTLLRNINHLWERS